MEKQKEEIQKLYESGILTKEEMEAELRKIPARNNSRMLKSCLSCVMFVLAGIIMIIVAIFIALIFINKQSERDMDENSETIALIQANEGPLSDRMTTDGKHLFLFDLGEFKDIDGFSDYAKKELDGKIHFWVCPTKDGSNIAVIKIKKFDSSYKATFNYRTNELTQEEKNSIMYIGPIIYDLGRQWIHPEIPNSKPTDWQPTATVENVRLTPKAELEKNKLLRYIAMGKISESNGNLYAGGRQLTKQEISDMVKFGMLTKKHWYSKPEIFEDYNRAIDNVKSYKAVK